MIYKTLKKVSNVCQLFIPNNTHTVAGVTITNNRDGSLTINGTGTGSGTYTNFTTLGKNNMPFKISDKLFISAYVISGTCSYLFAGFSQSGNPNISLENPTEGTYYSGNISKKDNYESRDALGFYVGNNTFNNFRVKFNIIDLTEMYGAGHEPTSVEQFRQDFPEEMYDYSPHCFVKSYKTLLKVSDDKIITSYKKSLVCTTKNLFDSGNFRTTDIANGTLIDVKENGWLVQGKFSSTPGTGHYNNGWFRPGDTRYNSNIGILLHKAGKVTVSAYYTVLENNSISTPNIYLYGTIQKVANYPGRFPDVGIKTRQYITYDIKDGEEGLYYPVFTLNSSKILIEDIQVEYGDTPTEYHPYGYL